MRMIVLLYLLIILESDIVEDSLTVLEPLSTEERDLI